MPTSKPLPDVQLLIHIVRPYPNHRNLSLPCSPSSQRLQEASSPARIGASTSIGPDRGQNDLEALFLTLDPLRRTFSDVHSVSSMSDESDHPASSDRGSVETDTDSQSDSNRGLEQSLILEESSSDEDPLDECSDSDYNYLYDSDYYGYDMSNWFPSQGDSDESDDEDDSTVDTDVSSNHQQAAISSHAFQYPDPDDGCSSSSDSDSDTQVNVIYHRGGEVLVRPLNEWLADHETVISTGSPDRSPRSSFRRYLQNIDALQSQNGLR